VSHRLPYYSVLAVRHVVYLYFIVKMLRPFSLTAEIIFEALF